MGRKRKMPSVRKIAKAHGLPVDQCWACGEDCGDAIERAHIQAVSHGGSDDPENIFLLCWRCHREQPDAAPPDAQWAWLRSREPAISRNARVVRAVVDYLFDGLDEAAVQWLLAQSTHDSIVECMAKHGSQPGASAHTTNAVASGLWGWAAQMRRMAESRREDAACLSHPHGHDLVLGVRPNENGAESR